MSGYSQSGLTGACIAEEVFRGVYRCSGGGKHLSGDEKARIVDFSAIRNMEVLRCLPIN